MKKILKNTKGITLIVLVITIILLLILAGISISALQNSKLISQTINAKEKNRIASLKETINLWNIERNINDNSMTLDEFVSELVNNGSITKKEEEEILKTGKLSFEDDTIVFEKYTYISNKEELLEFRDTVNNGYTFENETIVLTNNIDLNCVKEDPSTWWEPIGNRSDSAFNGRFDGNNYTISNLYREDREDFKFIALFSNIKNSTIKNLTVEGNFIVGADISTENNPATAGIVGVSYGKCKIINCINNVNASKESGGRETSGILGCVEENSTTIVENCVNRATIAGGNGCAGIIATVYGNATIKNCDNEGNVGNSDSQYVGGIVGRSAICATGVNIDNSYNSGSLVSKRYIGGILGYITFGDILINDCYNSGTINILERTATSYAGGIVGRYYNTVGKIEIINSHNEKNIIIEQASKSAVVGGILGETITEDAIISNCYNIGNLKGTYTGGICGLVSGSSTSNPKLKIINSYNVGSIEGTNKASGIVRCHIASATIEIQNAYYLSGTAAVGVENYEKDDATALENSNMQSQDFTNTLNNNLSNIESSVKLNEWKYVENNYPIHKK